MLGVQRSTFNVRRRGAGGSRALVGDDSDKRREHLLCSRGDANMMLRGKGLVRMAGKDMKGKRGPPNILAKPKYQPCLSSSTSLCVQEIKSASEVE